MTLSDETRAVVEFLQERTGGNLRKKNDIECILELTASADDAETFNALLTEGTSLWKVFGLLKRSEPGSSEYIALEKEFARAMNEMRLHITALCTRAPEHISQRFTDIYLALTSGAIKNLHDLAHDFAAFKSLQNDAKHGNV